MTKLCNLLSSPEHVEECHGWHVQATKSLVLNRYLIQRKQSGSDGSSFIYEAGPNAVDELQAKGGIDSYLDQVRLSVADWLLACAQHRLWSHRQQTHPHEMQLRVLECVSQDMLL